MQLISLSQKEYFISYSEDKIALRFALKGGVGTNVVYVLVGSRGGGGGGGGGGL